MFQKFLREWPIWTSILAAAVAVVAFLADLQGALDFIDKHVMPLLRISLPLGLLVLVLAAACGGSFYWGQRVAFLKGAADDRASIGTEGEFFDWLLTFLVSAKERSVLFPTPVRLCITPGKRQLKKYSAIGQHHPNFFAS
jgi:hypothetical protein